MFGWLKKKIENASTDAMANDLQRFIRSLQGADDKEIATMLVVANIVRLNLLQMGKIPEAALDLSIYRDKDTEMQCDMCTIGVNSIIKQFQSLNQPSDALGAMIWLHSVRALNVPELRILGKSMWAELSRGFPYLEDAVQQMRDVIGTRVPPNIDDEVSFVPNGLEPQDRPTKQAAALKGSSSNAPGTSKSARNKQPTEQVPRKKKPDERNADLKSVEDFLDQLGYEMTEYGVGLALLSIESNYTSAEIASHMALATLAWDSRRANNDIVKSIGLAAHARALIDLLEKYKENGLMREELFRNDARAMLKVAIPSPEQSEWIDKVLSDPMLAKDRVATSRIDYDKMTD